MAFNFQFMSKRAHTTRFCRSSGLDPHPSTPPDTAGLYCSYLVTGAFITSTTLNIFRIHNAAASLRNYDRGGGSCLEPPSCARDAPVQCSPQSIRVQQLDVLFPDDYRCRGER